MKMKFWIYILKSIDFDKTYVGFTNDLERRLKQHNSGKSIYTKKYKPWKIIFTEEVSDRVTAREREKYYKSAAGRKKIKLVLENKSPCSSVNTCPT